MTFSDFIGIVLCLLLAGVFLEFALDVIAEDKDE